MTGHEAQWLRDRHARYSESNRNNALTGNCHCLSSDLLILEMNYTTIIGIMMRDDIVSVCSPDGGNGQFRLWIDGWTFRPKRITAAKPSTDVYLCTRLFIKGGGKSILLYIDVKYCYCNWFFNTTSNRNQVHCKYLIIYVCLIRTIDYYDLCYKQWVLDNSRLSS